MRIIRSGRENAMSLYAIGDLHLAFSVDKPMDIFGRVWKNHEKKIWKYWNKRVTDRDTVVITGDHSWGRNLEQSRKDLDFIAELPGRKILLRGNHDMFWDAKKTRRLNEQFRGRLKFLQNNFFTCQGYALVGTKGYCYEGLDTYEHFEKIRNRELERLRISFEEARAAGEENYIMFLHYPPTSIGEAGVPRADFMAALDEMVEAALQDTCTATNPRTCTPEELRALFQEAYEGRRI